MNCLKPYYNLNTIALQEEFFILYMNRIGNVLGVYRHSVGTMSQTTVDIRLILATALKLGSQRFALSHNHPSGNLVPSVQDIQLTRKIIEAARIMEITVIDHLIVDPDFNFYSFADRGEL